MIGQRMDLLFDNFGQNTRGRGIIADVVQKDRLLERLMQYAMNVLDGFGTQRRLPIMFL